MKLNVLGLALAGLVATAGALQAGDFSTDFSIKDLKAAAATMPQARGSAPMEVAEAGISHQTLGQGMMDTWLPQCGGTAHLRIIYGRAYLQLREVANCSNFDILSEDGYTNYAPNQKLNGSNPHRWGDFEIPARFLGYNTIRVVVQSNSRKTRDYIKIKLYRWW